MHGDTDYTQAVKLEHLSPTWVRELDRQYGAAKAQNGGYFTVEAQFEAGAARPRWYDIVLRFLPWRCKHNN